MKYNYFAIFVLFIMFFSCGDNNTTTTNNPPATNLVTLTFPPEDTIFHHQGTPGDLYITSTWSANGTPNHYLFEGSYDNDSTFTTQEYLTVPLRTGSYYPTGTYRWRIWAVYGTDSVVSATHKFYSTF